MCACMYMSLISKIYSWCFLYYLKSVSEGRYSHTGKYSRTVSIFISLRNYPLLKHRAYSLNNSSSSLQSNIVSSLHV